MKDVTSAEIAIMLSAGASRKHFKKLKLGDEDTHPAPSSRTTGFVRSRPSLSRESII